VPFAAIFRAAVLADVASTRLAGSAVVSAIALAFTRTAVAALVVPARVVAAWLGVA
jgi:hypothetical protein